MKKVFAIMSLVVFYSFAMNAQTTSTDNKEKTEKVTEAEKSDKPAGSCCQKGGSTGEAKACCKKGDGTASTCSKSEGQGACCQKGGASAGKAAKKKMKKAPANAELKK